MTDSESLRHWKRVASVSLCKEGRKEEGRNDEGRKEERTWMEGRKEGGSKERNKKRHGWKEHRRKTLEGSKEERKGTWNEGTVNYCQINTVIFSSKLVVSLS